jgi:hypothetical protein
MVAPYLLGIVATLWGYAWMFFVAGLVSIGAAVYFIATERQKMEL